MKKSVFLVLAIIGFIGPYIFFFRYFSQGDFSLPALIQQIFANNVSTAFAIDLILSVIVFWVYLFAEADRLQMQNAWLYALASLLIGLSFALPLFLYFRERRLEER